MKTLIAIIVLLFNSNIEAVISIDNAHAYECGQVYEEWTYYFGEVDQATHTWFVYHDYSSARHTIFESSYELGPSDEQFIVDLVEENYNDPEWYIWSWIDHDTYNHETEGY